jgi:hypothetical protein
MEKYSLDKDTLLASLREEEGALMRKVSHYMMVPEKTASEAATLAATENRLGQVRSKITELDLATD